MAPKGVNSPQPTTAEVVGGVYNAVAPTLVDGQAAALQLDVNGKLITSGSAGGVTNVNIADVAGSPPALTNPLPIELSDGTNAVGIAGNPISVTVESTAGIIDENIKNVGNAAVVTSATGIQKVGIVGGAAGVTLDAVLGATKPANVLQVGGNDGTNAFALPLVSGGGAVVDNISQWGGTNVTAPPATTVPATGSEVAPVVKSIVRKQTQILTQTPLAALAAFTSAWFDSNASGDDTVSVIETNSSAGGSGTQQFQIQGSNDIVTPGPTLILSSMSAAGANAQNVLHAYINTRYWRIVYTNGSTTQVGGTMEIAVTSSNYQYNVQVSTLNNSSIASALQVTLAPSNNLNPGVTDSVNVFKQLSQDNTFSGIPGVANFVFAGAPGVVTASGLRTPNIFKTATVVATASGNTAVWTPAAGKKFRLMRFQITGVNLAATAATVITISFQDNVTGITIGTYDVLLPAIATASNILSGGVMFVSDWIDLGNGIISAVANNVLNANVSATVAGATGSFRYNVCGTEE